MASLVSESSGFRRERGENEWMDWEERPPDDPPFLASRSLSLPPRAMFTSLPSIPANKKKNTAREYVADVSVDRVTSVSTRFTTEVIQMEKREPTGVRRGRGEKKQREHE